MELLKCTGLRIGYDTKLLIDNLDFSVGYGDWLCVVGENGSGKSTLLESLMGLHKPLGGRIIFDSKVKKTDISFVPQSSDNNDMFSGTVREVVLSGSVNNHGFFIPFFRKEEKKNTEEVLEKFGLMDIADRSFRDLSGGQKQRVVLARSVVAGQKLLIMDEPVSGLDAVAATEFFEIIRKINQDGMTIIMICHDFHNALQNASHLLYLKGPGSYFHGTVQEFLESE